MIDEVSDAMGWERKHTIKALNGKVHLGHRANKRGLKPTYTQEVKDIIVSIWKMSEQPCGKRLKSTLPLWLASYERHNGELTKSIRKNILQCNPLGFPVFGKKIAPTSLSPLMPKPPIAKSTKPSSAVQKRTVSIFAKNVLQNSLLKPKLLQFRADDDSAVWIGVLIQLVVVLVVLRSFPIFASLGDFRHRRIGIGATAI